MTDVTFYILAGMLVLIGLASDRNYRKLARIEEELANLRKRLCPTNYDKMMELEERVGPGASIGTQAQTDWLTEIDERPTRQKKS